MIAMEPYDEDFEEVYYKKVLEVVGETLRNEIVDSCRKYFPDAFFEGTNNCEDFKNLILAKYKDLKNIYLHINDSRSDTMASECFGTDNKLNSKYKEYHDNYEKVRDKSCLYKSVKQKMNVKIVVESKMLTCPYCNRDYINSRGDNVSGAQLDHFYSRKKYPIFTLCLYNLVPVCANCNRIKGDKEDEEGNLVSPFDNEFDFVNKVKFSYKLNGRDDFEVDIKSNDTIKNIELLKIEEAYKIHRVDIQELINKSEVYNRSQIEELVETMASGSIAITKSEIKEMVFGKPLDPKDFGKRPLSKLKYDILKEINVF